MSSATGGPDLHLFESAVGRHVLVVDGSRIYDLEAPAEGPPGAAPQDLESLAQALAASLVGTPQEERYVDGRPLSPPPLQSLSLNVAQACNMACSYCYADAGRFGGRARRMSRETARAAVDRLIAESEPGAALTVGFMGGEPLLHRELVHDTARYAAAAARDSGRSCSFSLTTNGTLLDEGDAELFAELAFSVAVSIDGDRRTHDAERPMADGSGSYERLLAGLAVMERQGRPRNLSARVTVTAKSGELLPILDHLIGLGFDEVGFAAVLVSPDPALCLGAEDFPRFLAHMIACGEKALSELRAGRVYPFGNFMTALEQIHRGSHRPYPCGAGAAYLSVNAEGDLFACHRLIDDPRWAMGSVSGGSDVEARAQHLRQRHVDRQEPCRSCWARYLCGGGCYHEVTRRGRPGCDYIRGWLEFCLGAYAELSACSPERFAPTCLPRAPHSGRPTAMAL